MLSCFMAFRWSEAHGDSEFYKTKFVPKNHIFFSKSQATIVYQKNEENVHNDFMTRVKTGFPSFFLAFYGFESVM